jgi:hypothetical protein
MVSYLANGEVFDKPGIKIQTITDGSSNTILMAEGYNDCSSYNYSGSTYVYGYRYSYYNASYSYVYNYSYKYTSGSYSFSEIIAENYGAPRFGLVAGQTFQEQPSIGSYSQCNPALPQSFGAGAIQVLLGDGSVRGVTTGVSASTWQAAVTPTAGDVLGSDWDQ